MLSKTSLLNKGIIKNDLKGFYWFPILYTVALFFMVPLQIIMRLRFLMAPTPVHYMSGIFDFNGGGSQHIFILTAPVLLAIIMFHYLQKKNSSDMIHSLPVKRVSLFTSHVVVGLGFLSIPVVAIGVITWIIRIIYSLNVFYSLKDILIWAAITIVMNVVMFMSTVFIGTITGITLVQGVLTYILLFLPMGLLHLVIYNIQIFLYGYSWRFHLGNQDGLFMMISPLYRIINLYKTPEGTALLIYLLFSIILYIAGLYLYNRRKIENNMQPIVFKNLGFIFKYGVTFSVMLTAGLYFARNQGSIPWIIFGYIAASFLGYFIAEGILQKSIRVFNTKSVRAYAIYVGVIAIILLGVTIDATGYEKSLPSLDEIKGLHFSTGFYYYSINPDSNFYYNDENIKLIREIHEDIIMNKKGIKYNQRNYDARGRGDVYFVYQLENGKRISRSYEGIDLSPYKDRMYNLYSTMEYKKMNYPIFKIDPMDIERISFRAYETNKSLAIYDFDEINELLELFKEEVAAANFEELSDARVWANVDIMLKNNREDKKVVRPESTMYDPATQEYYDSVFIQWRKSFEAIDAWLFEKGYLERARLLPKDVSYMMVEKVFSYGEIDSKRMELGKGDGLVTYDKLEIDMGLTSYSTSWSYEDFPKYAVAFFNEGGQQITYGCFDGKHIPQFIKDYFKE